MSFQENSAIDPITVAGLRTQTLISITLLLASLFLSTASADQVVMKNGDRVTGAIVKQDGKTITIKTVQFGVVSAPWDQVASITTDEPVNVVLKDNRTIAGKLATTEGKIAISSGSTTVDVPPGDIAAMRNTEEQKAFERLLRPGWMQLWAGTASLGFAGSAGNARTLTFTTGVNAARVTSADKTTIYFNTIKASALVSGKSADTAQAVRGGLAYDHNLSPRMFLNVFNDYEYDRFQALDLRFVIGAGAGFHALKTERSRLDVLAGGDYNHSSFSTPLVRNSAEIYWGDDYTLKVTGATSLVQAFRMFNDLSNPGQYRVNFDIGASTKISKWLTWNLSVSDRYLNHPAPGRKTNDLLYTTGVGVAFAR